MNPNGTLWGTSSRNLSANAVWPFVVNIGPWQGSAVVDGSENLSASVVNKRSPSPFSSGAYLGISTGKLSNPVYVPLAMHNLTSASGLANSEIVIQNASDVAVNLSIQLLASSGSPGPASFVKSVNNLAAGAAFLYDLTTEGALTNGWFGSAVISAGTGAKLAVTSNLKSGANTIQAFNGFAAENLGTTWAVPLFTARLANGLNTPVTVQNLSGGQISMSGIQLKCVKDLASPGTNFSKYNSVALPNNGSYSFNPYTDTSIPTGWFGACQVIASGNVVVFVQMRNIGGTGNPDNAAAYEAMRGNGVGKVAIFPLIQKRLVDGSATAVTIQNLSASTAHLTFYYMASGNAPSFAVGPCAIAGNASVIHNHRVTDPNTTNCPLTNPTMPDSWQGSLVVTSSDQPIDGFIQLTNINNLAGDTLMAHNANTSP